MLNHQLRLLCQPSLSYVTLLCVPWPELCVQQRGQDHTLQDLQLERLGRHFDEPIGCLSAQLLPLIIAQIRGRNPASALLCLKGGWLIIFGTSKVIFLVFPNDEMKSSTVSSSLPAPVALRQRCSCKHLPRLPEPVHCH